jgi:hypothetical protein
LKSIFGFILKKYNGALHDKICLFLFVLDLNALLSHYEIKPKRIQLRVANIQGVPREPDIFWMGSTQYCAEEE